MITYARRLTINALAGAVMLGACDDDDGVTPPVEPPAPEATTFEVTIENVAQSYDFLGSGVFAIPIGAEAPGPLHAGEEYHFDFAAAPGRYLSFATMFVHSNDYFYAPDGRGIPLYEADGTPMAGDLTDQVMLWDAGTEANQEPGSGVDQAPRQTGLDTGDADSDDTVRLVTDMFGNLPDVADVIEVTLEANGDGMFHLHIKNVSSATTLMTADMMSLPDVPLAPGVWVVHSEPNPVFTEGEADRGEGLEGLAEDGTAGGLGEALAASTGLTSPIAPGVFAVHTGAGVLFEDGASASDGIESLAEDGDPVLRSGREGCRTLRRLRGTHQRRHHRRCPALGRRNRGQRSARCRPRPGTASGRSRHRRGRGGRHGARGRRHDVRRRLPLSGHRGRHPGDDSARDELIS